MNLYWNGHSSVLYGGEFGICAKNFKVFRSYNPVMLGIYDTIMG